MFLPNGRDISNSIKNIINYEKSGEIRLAVAYWGKNADFELNKNFRIICDLDSGCFDPKVIGYYWESFPKKVKRLRNLHAKVVISDTAAIVSSANMSTNGLGFEGSKVSGNYEAGYLTENKEDILSISNWFEDLWGKAVFFDQKYFDDALAKYKGKQLDESKVELNVYEFLYEKIASGDRLRACRSNILRICKEALIEDNLSDQEIGKIATWAVHLIINCPGPIQDFGKGSGFEWDTGSATNKWINERINKHNPEATRIRIEKIIKEFEKNQEVNQLFRNSASQALINLPWKIKL